MRAKTADQVGEEEMKLRAEHLRRQRDLIRARKKAERQAALKKFEDERTGEKNKAVAKAAAQQQAAAAAAAPAPAPEMVSACRRRGLLATVATASHPPPPPCAVGG